MKTRIFAILLVALSLCSCFKEEVRVTGITLDASSLVIPLNGTDQLRATISPSNADNLLVLWTSSNASVVKVSDTGALTAVGTGEAVITATSDGSGLTATCKVTVPEVVFPVESMTLDRTSLVLSIGQSARIVATIEPANATDKTLHWMSSDESVATVDDAGNVTAKDYGKTTIVVTTADGGIMAKCEVSVPKTMVTKLTLENEDTEITRKLNETVQLKASVWPPEATNPALRWSSNNEAVASVDENGLVTALSYGEAVISVSTVDGSELSSSLKVVVKNPLGGITLSPTSIVLYEYEQQPLTLTFTPEDAEDKSVIWSSSDESVAVVSYGVVHAVKAGKGKATISVKALAGDFEATCEVTVKCKVAGVKLDEHEITLKEGSSQKLEATVYPSRVSDLTVKWKSEDPSIAVVNDKGTVTALVPGTTKVTATSNEDNSFSDVCIVNVEQVVTNVTGITVSPASLNMTVGDKQQLSATIKPADATNGEYSWSTSDANIASVTADGLVTAVSAGSATICVTTKDGGYHANCNVKVRNKVDKITVTGDKDHIYIGQTAQLSYALEPADSDVEIEWASLNPEAATVSVSGVVTGKTKASAAKIVARTKDKTVVSNEYSIEVRKAVEKISPSVTTMGLFEGDSKALSVAVLPTDASYRGYTFETSSQDGGSVVFSNDMVSAVTPGVVTITFKPEDEAALAKGVSASTVVTVWQHVQSISITEPSTAELTLVADDTYKLEAAVKPTTAKITGYTWKSSDPATVSVDDNGNIKALKYGDAVITVTSKDDWKDISASIAVHVRNKVTGITLSDTELNMSTGDTHTLTYTVSPDNVDNDKVTWTSSKSSVARVTSAGLVEAVSAGTAVITATSLSKSGIKATCAVSVVKKDIHVESVSVTPESVEIFKGETAQLAATVLPANADNKNVSWSSNKTSVATVNADGVVSGVGVGEAVITATTVDGSKTATCTITVKNPPVKVSSVTLSEHSFTMESGTTHTLTATVLPENADDPTVEWSSSNENVATVSQSGVVTAKSVSGQAVAVITARAKDGENNAVLDECTVTVKAQIIHVTKLTIEPTNMSLYVGQTKKITYTISPSNAEDQSVTFVAPKASAVTVDQEGNVYGVKTGSSAVTVTTNDGGKSKTCAVTVTWNKVASIKVTLPNGHVLGASDALILRVGEQIALKAQAIGQDSSADPSASGLTWTNNSSIVSLSNGTLTALAVGSSSIRIKSNDSNANVYVDIPVQVMPAGSSGGNEGVEFDDWNF